MKKRGWVLVVSLVLALTPACVFSSQPPAGSGSGDVPLAPLPTDRPPPSGAGPQLGRWRVTSFEGDLTISVLAVGPLCYDKTTHNPPLPEESYLELRADGALAFKFSWASAENAGMTYDYSDRDGSDSTWTWPDGVEASSPLGNLLVYGEFADATHLAGRWELSSTTVFGDCQQTNTGTGSWSADSP